MARAIFSSLGVSRLLLVFLAFTPTLGMILHTGLEQPLPAADGIQGDMLQWVQLASANQERFIAGILTR